MTISSYLILEIAKKKRFKKLVCFINGRVIKHKDYFEGNSQIKSTYMFPNKIIDKLNNINYANNNIEK